MVDPDGEIVPPVEILVIEDAQSEEDEPPRAVRVNLKKVYMQSQDKSDPLRVHRHACMTLS